MRLTFATLATRSHFALAAVLAGSLAEHTGAHRRVLLWVDAPDDADLRAVASLLGFHEVLRTADVMDGPALAALRRRYSLAEVCFALKPALIRHLLQADAVVYLDSDVLVCAPLDGLLQVQPAAPILLTPHLLEPLPEDGRWPRDVSILTAGTFNLGFVAVRPGDEAARFLDWWDAREQVYGYLDPSGGLAADQKWCDLAPVLFPGTAVVRSAGANVGYWNLPARPLALVDGEWLAGGERLLFFHFSGFDPRRPDVLSRHQDRVDAAASPDLSRLLRAYAARVAECGARLDRALLPSSVATDAESDADARYRSLADFLPLHGREFVAQAYRSLLQREPDAAGLRSFAEALARGALSRWQVLGRLQHSREGRSRGAKLRGLTVGWLLAEIYRLPLAGPLAALLARWLRVPVCYRDLSAEDRLMAQCVDAPGGPVSERDALLARLRSR